MKVARWKPQGGVWLDPLTKADQRIDRKAKRLTRKREALREIEEQRNG